MTFSEFNWGGYCLGSILIIKQLYLDCFAIVSNESMPGKESTPQRNKIFGYLLIGEIINNSNIESILLDIMN